MDNIVEEIQTFVENSNEHIESNVSQQANNKEAPLALSYLINDQVNDIMKVERQMNDYIERTRIFLQKRSETLGSYVFQQGSTKDGGSLARKCYPNAPKHEVEIDLLYTGGEFPSHLERSFQAIPEKPAYIRIEYDISLLQYLHPKIRAYVDEVNRGSRPTGYLSSQAVKDKTKEMVQFRDTDGELGAILSMLFGFSVNLITIAAEDEVKQAAATTTININFGAYQMAVSVDHVPAIHLHFWPQQAKNWLSRNTVWPSREDRFAIAQDGCHVIPKPSSGGDQDLEWRFSFSAAEAKLFAMLTDKQKKVYFLFKAIFYKYIKPIQGRGASGNIKEVFFSYLAKTIMLFFCEDKIATHQIWQDENILLGISSLLQDMEHLFRTGKVAHFFIPDVNLLDDICRYAPETLGIAIEKLASIRSNVAHYVPFNLIEVAHDGKELTEKLKVFVDAIDKIGNFKDAVHLLRDMRQFRK